VQNLENAVQGKTFSNLGLNERNRKIRVFQAKTGHISETVRDTAKICY